MKSRKVFFACLLVLVLSLSVSAAMAATVATVSGANVDAVNRDYESFAEALTAVSQANLGDVTITLASGTITESTLRMTQKTGTEVTIVGNGSETVINSTLKITGTIGCNTTVKNIAFNGDGITSGYDYLLGNYDNNSNLKLTVENCSFTGTGKKVVAIKTNDPQGLTATNCTATGLHSFFQGTGGHGTHLFDTIVITGCKNGISTGTIADVVVTNCEISTDGYAVRTTLTSTRDINVTIEDSVISAETPVVVRNNKGENVDSIGQKDHNITSDSNTFILTSGSSDSWLAYEDGANSDLITIETISGNNQPNPIPDQNTTSELKNRAPQTGDESNIALWAALMALSAAAFVILSRKARFN